MASVIGLVRGGKTPVSAGDPGIALLPLCPDTAEGKPRRVGVELEFSGLDVEAAATLVQACFGGVIEPRGRYDSRVNDTRFGTFGVELDFQFLRRLGRREEDEDAVLDLNRLSEQMLSLIAQRVVPLEIVAPPIAIAQLGELEPLVARLREAGALGTRHSLAYAFGLQLNPELPALDARTVTAYFKAFLCLHDWLRSAGEVDVVRRLTPYIKAFSNDYVRKVVATDYWPDLDTLIDDYLQVNPDRNRALDMLPLFAHLDASRVRRHVDDPRIKARPTLHYRLPNCEIDQPEWRVLDPWRHWLHVEHLAASEQQLEAACAAYHEHLQSSIDGLLSNWAKRSERFLSDP